MMKNTYSTYEANRQAADSALNDMLAALQATKYGTDRDGNRAYAYSSGYLQSMLASFIADQGPTARKRMMKSIQNHIDSLKGEVGV